MALGEDLRKARMRKKISASEVAAATRMKVQIVEALEREDFSKIAAPIYGKGFIRLYAEHVGLDPSPLISEYMSKFVVQEEPSLIVDRFSLEEEEEAVEVSAEPEGGQEEKKPQAELDLFVQKQAVQEAEEREKAASVEEPESAKTDIPAAKSGVQEAKKRFASWANVASDCVLGGIRRVGELLRACRIRLEQRQLPNIPWKSFPVMLGIFIIVILIVSGISRCIRTDAEPPLSTAVETQKTQEPLRLAVEPADPYID